MVGDVDKEQGIWGHRGLDELVELRTRGQFQPLFSLFTGGSNGTRLVVVVVVVGVMGCGSTKLCLFHGCN